MKLLKALSLHGPWPYEKEYGKSGRVKDVDAPGVKEEDVPEVGEAGSAEDAHKTLKREDFLDHDEGDATSVIHFLTKTFPPSEKTFLLSEVRLPLDLGNILFYSNLHKLYWCKSDFFVVDRLSVKVEGKVKPQKLTMEASSVVPRSKHIREKVFSCHTLGCLAKGGEVEGELWISSTEVSPDPVDQLVNLPVRESAVEQKKVKPPAELQNSSFLIDILVVVHEERLERLKPKEDGKV